MRALTKKPPTDAVELCFTGPAAKRQEAVDLLRGLGFEAREAPSRPWREVLPFQDAELPGVFLAGARYREDMTQAALAQATGIPRRHISEMENGKRPIGRKNARLLAEALNIDPRRLLAV
ncbi:helix-turn-helix domain-containing protein [Desulfolutivibrio sulfoxidireducens]|uniref:helix-turn-helix domain-containing protein n=1 Tax=Desulfolutivibrio sulfoxidireducens TaxID=2773299 RepID=UPI00159DF0EA|nr:helix-turn-helix transcriptional regulator [Desulfolutivibrio sulfoxidireducens]QLA17679.1 helix-turn-helix domain-containing protein [Desulfolutivibrio sulfoxidireducens]QLA21254.1 helix-turn-helix domain-containing protein [Desulfolutivibrio sulfoxidireducens]